MYDVMCTTLRYVNDPWLVSLDWTVKHLKGTTSKKKANLKVLKAVKEYYRKKERSGRKKVEERKEKEQEEEEENFRFIISPEEPVVRKKSVHMPGYPE